MKKSEIIENLNILANKLSDIENLASEISLESRAITRILEEMPGDVDEN